jgi:spore maturation protein CgeB
MRLVVFGLTVSSSWGNGHATLWRGLIRALTAQGHTVTFFERDVPYYAQNRDLLALPEGATLKLYSTFETAREDMSAALRQADAGIVTSYCPDAIDITALQRDAPHATRCFYDLDTGVTLARLEAGEAVGYLGPDKLAPFDLVLSYTGGAALDALRERLGARRVAPLYGWVDETAYFPAPPRADVSGLMTYLGTYAADRQAMLETLLVQPARRMPEQKFIIGGALYPDAFPWAANIWFLRHVPPEDHRAFYASGRLTLNVTRAAMARMGWCPSGRLFEAAACGVPILSDRWAGLDTFFTPGEEIFTASTTDEAVAILGADQGILSQAARRARERTLDQHTARHRARELVDILEREAVA